jgi:phytoene dehydrogenase-like protein
MPDGLTEQHLAALADRCTERGEVAGAGTVHVAGSERDLLGAIAQSAEGLPPRPFLLLGQQSIADPSRAPEGQHTAWAYTHGPPEADWAALTDRHVEAMEAQIERSATGSSPAMCSRPRT